MKINRKDPKHVTFIAKSMLFTTLATVASKLTKKNKTTTVVLYGHQLNGNIKAFLDYCVENKKNIDIYFMADPWYIKKLNARELGLKGLLNMSKFSDMLVVARSDIVMTTHGLHLFFKILKHARPRFIDVWHGIP